MLLLITITITTAETQNFNLVRLTRTPRLLLMLLLNNAKQHRGTVSKGKY